MTERANVLEVNGREAVLQCFDDPGCDSCSSMFCSVQTRTIQATIDEGIEIKTGDCVDVFVPPSGAIRTGFFVLIFPLIMFAAAYLAFGFVQTEVLRVFAGLGGLVLGFGLVFLFGKRDKPEMPRIVRVLPSSGDFQPLRRDGPDLSAPGAS